MRRYPAARRRAGRPLWEERPIPRQDRRRHRSPPRRRTASLRRPVRRERRQRDSDRRRRHLVAERTSPGLGDSAAAAVRAYVAHRNATGGVCGREVVLRGADDGTDAARYRATLSDMDSNVLGIAGGFAIGDIGSESLITSLGIPIVNAPSARTGELPSVFDINPDFPRTRHADREVPVPLRAGRANGLDDLHRRRPVPERGHHPARADRGRRAPDRPRQRAAALHAQLRRRREAAANSGANYLWFIADTNGQASMARSVAGTGHDWLFKEFSYTTYGTNFIELAGEAAEGATSWIRSLPTEESSANEAMATYVEWMNRVAPGLPQDLFSIDSWVAAKAFFEALEALPGPISREALVQQLASIESLRRRRHVRADHPRQDLSQGCFMAMIVRDGTWQRLAPRRSATSAERCPNG